MKNIYRLTLAIISILIISQLAFSEMPIIKVDETELVNLEITTVDLDKDNLTYEFTEPLNKSGQWQTNYGDYGDHVVNISVSDGEIKTTQQVLIKVAKINWPPVLEDIEDVIMGETETIKIYPKAIDDDNDEITYTISAPIGDDGEWQTGFNNAGEYNILVTATAGEHTVSKEFTLTIENLNREPIIESSSPEIDPEIDEEGKIRFNVQASDPDKEVLTYSWKLDDEEVSQEFDYTYTANYESEGTHTIEVEISDGEAFVSQSWILTVTNVNRAPILESIENIVVDETDKIIVNFTSSDPDRDDIKYSISDPIGFDKEWQTTFDDAGVYEIEVIITDGKLTDTKTFEITVNDIDRAPLFKKIDNVVLNETNDVSFTLQASDPDEDTITFSAENLPEGAILVGNKLTFNTDYGTVQKPGNWINKGLDFFNLADIYYGTSKSFVITLTAAGKNLSTTQDFKITVNNVNRAPKLLDIDDVTIEETDKLRINPAATEYDNDKVMFTISEPVGNDGIWKPDYNSAGVYSIEITASDGEYEDTQTIELTVKNSNRLPILKNIRAKQTSENTIITIIPSASDPDNDTIELSVENVPPGYNFSDGEFSWIPDYDFSTKKEQNTATVRFVASDDEDYSVIDVPITVKDINRAPVILNSSVSSDIVRVETPVIFAVDAVDLDGDKLTYEWKFATFSKLIGTSKLKRTFLKSGRKTISVTISDGIESVVNEWEVNVADKTQKIVKKTTTVSKTTTPKTTTTTTPKTTVKKTTAPVTPKTNTYVLTKYVIEEKPSVVMPETNTYLLTKYIIEENMNTGEITEQKSSVVIEG